MKLPSVLSGLFRKRPEAVFDPPEPETPFCAIGDVHGQLDLLKNLLARLPQDHQIICVGDYIDRGPDSLEVLRYLKDRPEIICLKGNHEEMMLAFIDAPEERGPRWIRNGGLQTMAGLGVAGLSETVQGPPLHAARAKLVEYMGEELLEWLRNLPVSHRTGNVAVVHAGANPAEPLEDQSDKTLVWGHRDFFEVPRQDGLWIVHGHTIFDRAQMEDGRISLDTGAFATGRLSAAIIAQGRVEFVTTGTSE